MNRWAVLIASIGLVLAGCQTMPKPSPGMAALRVNVIAEPKAGSKMSGDEGSAYVTVSNTAGIPNSGAFEQVDYPALDEIVVWLEPAMASTDAASQTAPIAIEVDAQKPAAKVNYAVGIGQTIIVRNVGSRSADFYSVSDGNDFDLGPVPPAGRAQYTVRSAGLIEMLSDPAKDPVAKIYAAPSRWVSVARSGRSIDFNDLPPGRYRLVSWHPRLPGSEVTITLSADQSASVSIKVGVNALPKVGAK